MRASHARKTCFMAFQELLKVRSAKYVEQKAFDGGVSHRGSPGCVDCVAVRDVQRRGTSKSQVCPSLVAVVRSATAHELYASGH